jgi:hypothetical protein
MFCGNREQLPPRSYQGTPLQCFKRGIGIGRYIQSQKEGTIRREERKRTEAISSVLVKRQLTRQIETQGLLSLKRDLRIGNLNKDLVRSIATRLTGTANPITGYSQMSRERLIEELVQRGFKR